MTQATIEEWLKVLTQARRRWYFDVGIREWCNVQIPKALAMTNVRWYGGA